jgi:hypothetical protein
MERFFKTSTMRRIGKILRSETRPIPGPENSNQTLLEKFQPLP